jgi:signal transduction histidine kinase
LPAVLADLEKTSWVLINFLTNAIKYSPENNMVEIAVVKKENKLQFSVTDHGKGIDQKYLPRIFDRYFKVPGTTEHNSTGLGLAISKEFIEAQGGTISVESEIAAGSRFGFTLPFG